MNANRIIVNIETKSSAGQKAIESLLNDENLCSELMERIESTVRSFVDQSGVMGTKPFEISAGEAGVQKLMREKLALSKNV